jgi:hypothetical protein
MACARLLVSPKIFKAGPGDSSVMLDVLVAEIVLQSPRIVPGVRQRVSASVGAAYADELGT